MAHTSRQQKEILLMEDNPADVTLLQQAVLEYGKLAWRIYRVADGEAALAFLRHEGGYAGMPLGSGQVFLTVEGSDCHKRCQANTSPKWRRAPS